MSPILAPESSIAMPPEVAAVFKDIAAQVGEQADASIVWDLKHASRCARDFAAVATVLLEQGLNAYALRAGLASQAAYEWSRREAARLIVDARAADLAEQHAEDELARELIAEVRDAVVAS